MSHLIFGSIAYQVGLLGAVDQVWTGVGAVR